MVEALIVGAGVAGPALAVALTRAGIGARLLESRPERDLGRGAFLALAPNGVNALRTLGLPDLVQRADGIPLAGICFRDAAGRQIGRLDGRADLDRYGARTHLLTREALSRELRRAASEAGVPVTYDARLTDLVQDPDGVRARLADGTTVHADVVLGCDGVRSTVRTLAFPQAPAPTYTGLVDCGGFAQVDLPDTGEQQMVFGRRGFFGYVVHDGTAYWFSNLARPEPDPSALREVAGTDDADVLDTVRARHADDPRPVRQILAAATDLAGTWPVHDLPSLPAWHHGRIGVLGDAAHAVSPSAGQGAALALEDAAVLAICLRDHTDPAAALAEFEQRRRPRAETIVRLGRRLGNHKIPGPAGAWLRNRLLPLFLKAGTRQTARQYAYRIDWTTTSPTEPRR